MDAYWSKGLFTALFFVVITLTGFWLSGSGKPYGVLPMTVHKLISVGAIVYLANTLIRSNQAAGLEAIELTIAVITGMLFLSLIATGGIMSAKADAPAIVVRLHHIVPYLTVASSAVTLYLVLGRR